MHWNGSPFRWGRCRNCRPSDLKEALQLQFHAWRHEEVALFQQSAPPRRETVEQACMEPEKHMSIEIDHERRASVHSAYQSI